MTIPSPSPLSASPPQSAWPLAPGHERRLPLYQLYHVLNHLNLFGHGYHGQAVRLCREILSN